MSATGSRRGSSHQVVYNTVLPEPVANDANDTLESRAQWAAVLDEFLKQSDTYPLEN